MAVPDAVFQMYEQMYAYDRLPLDAKIESESDKLALLAPGTRHLQRCLWQRARYRLPFPAENRIRTLSDRRLLSAQRRAIVPRARTIAICLD